MKSIEAFISAPIIVSVLTAAQITLRGRAEAEDVVIEGATQAMRSPIDPVFGLAMIGVLLASGIILVVREMIEESRERRKDDL